jgi:proline iminopeptidase
MNSCRSWLVGAIALAVSACAFSPPLPDDGFVDVPGGRVAFRVIGNGDGVPLLVIHGGPGGTGCSYVSAMSGVAASRPVVIYDQLGSGNSDRMTDLERDAVLSRFVAEVVAIREQLGLERVHLLGHSWGAAVVLEYLLTADPQGVLSASFVGPLLSTPRWLDDANALVGRLPEDAQRAIEAAKASGDYGTEEFAAANTVFESEFGMRSLRVPGRFPACESTPVRFNVDLYEYMWGPSEFVSTGTLRDYDRGSRLAEIDLPVLFVIGEYDEVRPGTAEQFHAQVRGSALEVIPDAAHFIQADQPQRFNQAIAGFLDAVERGR